ncbi:uncharacterized protein LOC143865152 [Tasmannia lanceolata]|uniref:uncharacterized protein LOC143865152 n=1 Tax=Tasmannia lanceolata TaxID=3420 RepID=UPI004063A1F8
MEIFSCILNKAQAMGKIKTPFSKRNLNINHVMYDDDVMIFITPDIESVAGIKDCLHSFKLISGLEVNVQKSEVFLSGTPDHLKNQICSSLYINEGTLPIKYLGLPLITKRLSSQDCQPLLSKIRSRLGMWNNKKLSKAGRIELIKSVLTSFQIYWSATYNIPTEILLEIEKMFRNFLWGGTDHQKKYHPIAWESLCRPKKEGGVGIRRVVDINKASQLKLLWHIVHNRRYLWVRWFKVKYLKKSSFWNRPMPSNPPCGVRSIHHCRDLAKPYLCYCVGKGRDIDFWTDPWHPDGPVQTLTSEGKLFCITKKISIENMKQDGSWDHMTQQPHLPQLKKIMRTGLYSKINADRIIWKENPNGNFSLRSAWNQCRSRYSEVPWFKTVWNKGHILRHSFTTWPEQRFFKVNTDAAVQNGKGGIGGLIRNSAGEVTAMLSIRLGCEEIHILEMKAILHGIRLALLGGQDSIWIESDSLTAVNVILEKWECPWKAVPIVEEIHDALLQTQKWKSSHTWTEANGAADFLSKPDCCCAGAVISPSIIPPKLRDIMELDAAGHIYPRL